MKFRSLIFACAASLMFASCSETIDNTGTCFDGNKNQGEQEVDCGGPCARRCESCGDGIMNQGETAVDCGGPCDPCYPRMSAAIDSDMWWSTSRTASEPVPGRLRMQGSNGSYTITIDYSGTFTTGTVATGTYLICQLEDPQGTIYTSEPGGSITFTTFDVTNKKVSGIFEFQATNTVSGNTYAISSGIFTELSY